MGYNGWSNWETWHTALLIDNTEQAQKQAFALAQRCAAIKAGAVKGKAYDEARAVKAFRRAFSKFATETRKFHDENAREIGGGWLEPFGVVDWREIALNQIEGAELDAEG